MNILILDNYDSFTFNLYHLVEELAPEGACIEVHRNDKIDIEEIDRFNKIIISPGPGMPYEAGITKAVISNYYKTKSILGVCLGHQAIVEVFGGRLKNLESVLHGVSIPVRVINSSAKLFRNCPREFETGRYHSWIANSEFFPEELEVTAIDDHGTIQALQHKQLDVYGVQFHPESILTPLGEKIIRNWIF
jgi:anthranilate synthase component 2